MSVIPGSLLTPIADAVAASPDPAPPITLLPGVADWEYDVQVSTAPRGLASLDAFASECRARTPAAVPDRCRPVRVVERDGLALYSLSGAWPEADEPAPSLRYDTALIAVLRADGAATQWLSVSILAGMGSVGAVEHFASPAGPLLCVPLRYSGTGAGVGDLWFLADGAGWRQVDNESWLRELALPAGHGVWKGVVVDPATFTARTAVWREGDGNC